MTAPKLTRELLGAMRRDVDAALLEVAKKHGILLRLGNGTFDDTSAKFQLQVSVGDPVAAAGDPTAMQRTKAAADWTKFAPLHRLPVDLLHKKVKTMGAEFTILGYMPTREKYTILVQKTGSAKLTLLPVDAVMSAQVVA